MLRALIQFTEKTCLLLIFPILIMVFVLAIHSLDGLEKQHYVQIKEK